MIVQVEIIGQVSLREIKPTPPSTISSSANTANTMPTFDKNCRSSQCFTTASSLFGKLNLDPRDTEQAPEVPTPEVTAD